ncbi:MYO7A protein, partial [Polypterus senegalus]
MDRKKKCATSVKSFSGDDSGNTSDTKCQDRRKTGVVDSKSAAERTARISDAQKVSEAAGTSYISESRASAAKIQGPRRDFPKICTTTGSRGNPGKRTPATDAAKPKDLQVAPARAASLSPLCRGYTINPIVPSSRGDVISVAQAMHREKFGERVKELFDPEREAALKAIQTGVYIGWRCPEFTWDCFRVGDGSKCFCGHLLKEHKNYTGSSVHVPCAVQSCRCKAFAFIASRPEDVGEFWLRKRPGFDPDTWRAMCKCKHSHEEHDASFSHICKKKAFCNENMDEGTGSSVFHMYYYSSTDSTCYPFIYKGEGGNNNRFDSDKECMKNCSSNTQDIYPEGKQMCVLEPDPGMCLARMLKWYFDTKTKTCHTFIYGGCKGNGNNFETKKQCQDLCARTIVGIIGGCMFIIALIAAISYFVICGESGAGKTESTKLLLRQIMELCKANSQLERQILQVNPLLEAFGNAQTVMNDNSSRFGKYIQLRFQNASVKGAKINEYLLEKSRVVHQDEGERNFHIFYYMLGGISAAEKEIYGLLNPVLYRYINNQYGTDEMITQWSTKYLEVCNAMDMVGFHEQEKVDMMTILAGILSLGNISFEPQENGILKVTDQSTGWLKAAAGQFGVQEDELLNCLICTMSVTRGESINRYHSQQQAEDARDSIAKVAYGRVFGWIVSKINELLAPKETFDDLYEIGILDIFGFENFAVNRYEQLCINLANEQLQYFFNHDLFLAKPVGIFSLLDEQSAFPQATDKNFVEKLNSSFKGNAHFEVVRSHMPVFNIVHYAGKVQYNASGFLEKNRDTIPANIRGLFINSVTPLLSVLFAVLMEKMFAANPHFIRCIKPNSSKKPDLLDSKLIMDQEELAKLIERLEHAATVIQKNYLKYICRRKYRKLIAELKQRKLQLEKEEEERRRKEREEEEERKRHLDMEQENQRPPVPMPRKRKPAPQPRPRSVIPDIVHRHLPPVPRPRSKIEVASLVKVTDTINDELPQADSIHEDEEVLQRQVKRMNTIHWFRQTQARKVVTNGAFPCWFHGMISRRQAEDLMTDKPPGCFLIRVGQSRNGYTLTYRGKDRCRHYLIEMQSNGKYVILGEDRAHASLIDLIEYHKTVGIQPFMEVLVDPCGQKCKQQPDYEELQNIIKTSSIDEENVDALEDNEQLHHELIEHPSLLSSSHMKDPHVPPVMKRIFERNARAEAKNIPKKWTQDESNIYNKNSSRPFPRLYPSIRLAMREIQQIQQVRDLQLAKSAASSTVQEGTIELSELKVLLAELTQDIKKSEKANEKATGKRLKQEMKQANERLRQEVQLELRQVLGKIEERIQENSVKLGTLTDQLENFKETFTNRIEMAEHLAASAEERAVNVLSECKKLGDRLAALEDGSRRFNVRIEGLPENRESSNPVKFAAELFSKIIGGDFKAESEKAAAYRVRGSNTVRPRPRSFIVRFERLSFKLEVMALLRNKEDIIYENNHICIFPDFSPATATKRAAFYNIKQRLRQASVKYSLLYLAKLKVEWQGQFYVFASKEEAENKLRKLIPGLF